MLLLLLLLLLLPRLLLLQVLRVRSSGLALVIQGWVKQTCI
jgi:hypothetical protein